MQASEHIRVFVERLLAEGDTVISTKFMAGRNTHSAPPKSYVDMQAFAKWRASCRLLISLLGDLSSPWRESLSNGEKNTLAAALVTQGTLQAIKEALELGLLIRYEDLVFAEAFSDLMEQAEYLLSQGYFLASGVLLRAVLEERLKRLCTTHEVEPNRERPTINDYNTSLYKGQVYDKLIFKQVDALAAIGNDAAHNSPTLSRTDVENFRTALARLLERFAA